jgi:4-alpha-methyl-delta7-sterol-4alpha-methyl oxidase
MAGGKAIHASPRPLCAATAPADAAEGCKGRHMSGLLSASFMVRCRKNWRGALHKALWTGVAFSLTLAVAYHISVETLRLATSASPLVPSDAERVELNLRVWHTWFSELGDYAIFGLGPAAVHVLSFWLTHTLLNLIDRSTAFRILEQYRVPDSSVEDDDVDGGEPCARRVLSNQALALAVALLVSPLLRYRVGPWDASPLPSFGRVQCSILFFALVAECTTYYLHRLLHTPWLWRNVHVRHHRYCAGRSAGGIAALDMHAVEFLALKLLPILCGPLLLPSGELKLLSIYLWVGISTIVCAAAHSQFNFPALPNPVHRWCHLAAPGTCFGVFGVLDLLHSTDIDIASSTYHQEALKEHEPQQTEEPQQEEAQQEEEEQEPRERPPRQQPSLRGETSGLVVPRGKAVGSKAEILSYSLVHQAALILLGILSNTSTYRTRCWIPVSSYALVGLGMWCTHWLGHRKIIPGWFEFHVMGATNAFVEPFSHVI